MKFPGRSLKSYQPYVGHLSTLLRTPFMPSNNVESQINLALNGQASRELRKIIPLNQLRKLGAFFTGEALAEKVMKHYSIKVSAPITDPACGTGDLLIAAAKKLPVSHDLKSTLQKWGALLYGYDVINEFVEIAKIRLALLAIKRLGITESFTRTEIKSFFPNIRVSDGLAKLSGESIKGLILTNPPYTLKKNNVSENLGKGLVSLAAVFLEQCILSAASNANLIGIFPDVIRTGSRYSKLRNWISQHCDVKKIQLLGRFERDVDVDVFALHLVRKKTAKKASVNWYGLADRNVTRVKDSFDVHVGAVVPHRHKKTGSRAAYITAKCIEKLQTIKRINETRKFTGTCFKPPFVVIRRTSSPTDRLRASGAVILGKRKVAVENHLIVMKPKKNSKKRCVELLNFLQSQKANAWFNKRIRCRHLTVASLKELPYVQSGGL